MEALTRYALPALVAVASTGSFVMCVLVLRHGLPGRDDDPEREVRSLGVLRAGQAFAAIWFAVIVALGVVALSPGQHPGHTMTALPMSPGIPAQGVLLPPPRTPVLADPGTGPTLVGSVVPPADASAGGAGHTQGRVPQEDVGSAPAPSVVSGREVVRSNQAVAASPAGRPAPEAPRLPREVTPQASARPGRAGGAREVGAAPREAAASLPPAQHSRSLALPDRDRAGPPAGEDPRVPGPSSTPPGSRPDGRPLNGADAEHPSALPTEAGSGRRVRATIRGVKVDVEHRSDDVDHLYVIRLLDASGRPVTTAEVSLQARTPTGTPLRATAEPDTEAGVYRGRIGRVPEPRDLRLRVVQRQARFEMALGEPVSWD